MRDVSYCFTPVCACVRGASRCVRACVLSALRAPRTCASLDTRTDDALCRRFLSGGEDELRDGFGEHRARLQRDEVRDPQLGRRGRPRGFGSRRHCRAGRSTGSIPRRTSMDPRARAQPSSSAAAARGTPAAVAAAAAAAAADAPAAAAAASRCTSSSSSSNAMWQQRVNGARHGRGRRRRSAQRAQPCCARAHAGSARGGIVGGVRRMSTGGAHTRGCT